MTATVGTCPFSPDVQDSKRNCLLDCLPNEVSQARAFSAYLLRMPWTTTPEEVVCRVQALSGPPDCGSVVDYPKSARHLLQVLALQSMVGNMVQHYVGRYVSQLSHFSSRAETHRDLGNAAETLKTHEYRDVLEECAQGECTSCSQAKCWEEDDQATRGARVLPCKTTQVVCKLLEAKYRNLGPTYFSQCLSYSQSVPLSRSPLRCFSEPPSELRRLAVRYPAKLKAAVRRKCPAISTGLNDVFRVPSPVDAIHYADGDGGLLSLDRIPGLEEYILGDATLTGLPIRRPGSYVEFREANHDAIELGHCYTVHNPGNPDRTASGSNVPFGYQALVAARANLAKSEETLLVPLEKDRSGLRLMVEIFTRQNADSVEHGVETGVRLVRAGLSFPIDDGPARCRLARNRAKVARAGVWRFGEGVDDSRLKPWNLKRFLDSPGESERVTLPGDVDIAIHNMAERLNEAHVFLAESTIPGAGRGLFLRPGRYNIPKDRVICSYQAEPEEEDANQGTDHLMEVYAGGGRTLLYQAARYDGQNIGRFINQGGLVDGLKNMCALADTKTGKTSFRGKEVNDGFLKHCNAYYRVSGRELQIRAIKDIKADATTPTELFANYGHDYWVKYVSRHPDSLDCNNLDIVQKCILWCLLANDSCWSATERQPGQNIHEAIKTVFRNMPCPVEDTGRRRPTTR